MRGFSVILMIVYHLCFDLSVYRWMHADFNHDSFWLGLRSLIVSMFLVLAGVSLVLWSGQREGRRKFWERQFRIGLCALLVSAGSYLVFPQTFIFFGILHFIFAASLIGAALARLALPAWGYAAAGALAATAGIRLSLPLFDAVPLQWLGFMTHKPLTEDYVPLFPWIGVFLAGSAAGRSIFDSPKVLRMLAATRNRAVMAMSWMGRHSLAIYMLHQPILLGILYLVSIKLGWPIILPGSN